MISSSSTGQPVAAQLASVISGSIQAPARSCCALVSISAPWTPAAVAGDLLSLAQLTARSGNAGGRAGDLQRQHRAAHGRAAGVGDLRQHPGTGPELLRPGVDLRALDARSCATVPESDTRRNLSKQRRMIPSGHFIG